MNNFWNNISRYPRFFISSVVGLILIILAPFKNLFKIMKLRFLIPIIAITIIFVLYKIISSMAGI